MQLVLGAEIYLDPAALAPSRSMRTRVPSVRRSFSSAARVWTSVAAGALARRGCVAAHPLDHRFGLAHRQIARDHLARDLALAAFVRDGEQRARMAHRQAPARDFGAHFLRQLQQPHVVGDRRSILADRGGDFFLRHVEFAAQLLVRGGLIDGIQVFALDVLDERHLEQLRVSPAATSLTTTGTRVSPARCAARQRRSPAMMR